MAKTNQSRRISLWFDQLTMPISISKSVDPNPQGNSSEREVQGCKVYVNVRRKVGDGLSMGSLFLRCNDQQGLNSADLNWNMAYKNVIINV